MLVLHFSTSSPSSIHSRYCNFLLIFYSVSSSFKARLMEIKRSTFGVNTQFTIAFSFNVSLQHFGIST